MDVKDFERESIMVAAHNAGNFAIFVIWIAKGHYRRRIAEERAAS